MYCLILKKNKKEWTLDGEAHRTKGPAINFSNGEKWWATKGRMNRDHNLPAVERPNGTKEYWINGQEYNLQENGTREFIDLFGKLNREDLPAVEYANGDKEFWLDGKRHRSDGPAVIYGNKQYWFINGVFIKCIV
ncbi:MAG: hypothetical protein EKK64_06610 [Neisseriaceae bacterium]|nr:MAG: hypothetical protein EKK64_06610 [Neisseriaceae bacterium]